MSHIFQIPDISYAFEYYALDFLILIQHVALGLIRDQRMDNIQYWLNCIVDNKAEINACIRFDVSVCSCGTANNYNLQ